MNSITITRHSERGRPIAAPVARALSLEEELEAERLALEEIQAQAAILLSRMRLAMFIGNFGRYAALTASLFCLVWLSARLATGV